jgi:hypothetical protein
MPYPPLSATRIRIKNLNLAFLGTAVMLLLSSMLIVLVITYILHYSLVSACCNGAYTPLYDSRLVLSSAAAPFEPQNMQLHAHTGAHLLSGQHTTIVQPTGPFYAVKGCSGQHVMGPWCYTSPSHMRVLGTCTPALPIGRLHTCQEPCATLGMHLECLKQYYEHSHPISTR